MWIEILHNLGLVTFAAAMFGALVIANVLLGAYYNVKKLQEDFGWKRFSEGLIKGALLLAANFLLAAVITSIAYWIILYQLPDLAQNITVILLIAVIWAKAIIKYIQVIAEKNRLILDGIVLKSADQNKP